MRTSNFQKGLAALSCLVSVAVATPAFAQEEGDTQAVTVSGSVGLVTDYRFRGVSQSDEGMALQGGFTVSHESGFYAGTWGSNLAGWGTFGGPNLELDIYAGYATTVGDVGLDVGVTWFMYPSGADDTDFFEGYAKIKGTTGPLSLTAGFFYAPKQFALSNQSNTSFSRGQKTDNIYVAADASLAIPDTPVTINAHIGASDGNPGLGPNGTSIAPTGRYADWSLGAAVNVYGPLTLSVSYVDTDIGRAESAYLLPNFATVVGGNSIADATVVVALTAAF